VQGREGAAFETIPLLTSTPPGDVGSPYPGTLVDTRAPAAPPVFRGAFQGCDSIRRVVFNRQRTTLGPGVQLSVGLLGPDGRALSSAAHADCLTLERDGAAAWPGVQIGLSASNALTLILAQPSASPERNAELARAVRQLFLSRPAGERVALYRWGVDVQQVSDFTNHFDGFSAAVERGLGPLEGAPTDARIAVGVAEDRVLGVVNDGPAWVRSIVVVAPDQDVRRMPALQPNANLLLAMAGAAESAGLTFDAGAAGPSAAVGWASALLDEFRDQGFVTFGSCTDGIETSARVEVTGSDVGLPVTLKDALPEERTGACDPPAVAGFDAAETRVMD
jgi:hypothetical protein